MSVFDSAKTEFNKNVQKTPEKISGDWEHFKGYVRKYLGTKHDEIEYFASKINYPGHDKDKSAYVTQLGTHVKEMIKDKKVGKQELVDFYSKLHQSSEKIIQRLKEKQKGYEILLYRKVEEEVTTNYRKGNFEHVINKLQAFKKTLSPLNTTESFTYTSFDIFKGQKGPTYTSVYSFDYTKPDFKLDMVIHQRILALKEQKQLYQAVLKKGVYLKGRKKENYILGKDNSGNIKLGDVYWNGEDVAAKNEIKVNWSDLLSEIQKNKYRLQKVTLIDKKGIQKSKDFTVEENLDIKIEKKKLRDAKYIKQINYIFNNMKFVESMGLSEVRKPIVLGSIKEIFNSMGEFFYYNASRNEILPHTKFDNLNEIQKIFLIKEIFTKIQQAIKRRELEQEIEKEKNPHLKALTIAEVAMMNGDYLKAYAHARKFIRAATGKNMKMSYLPSSGTAREINTVQNPALKTKVLLQKIPKEKIFRAQLLIKNSSDGIIKIAERYLASLKDSKVDTSQAKDAIEFVKNLIEKGKVNNLHDAFRLYEEHLETELKKGIVYGTYQRNFKRLSQRPLFESVKAPGNIMGRLNMVNKPYFSRSNILRELALSTEAKNENNRIGYLNNVAKQTALHGLGKYSTYKPGVEKLNLPGGKGPRFSAKLWYTDSRQIGAANVLFQAAMTEDIKKMRRIEQKNPNYWKEIEKHRENLLKDSDFYKEAEKLAKQALKKKEKYTEEEYNAAVENSKKLLMKLKIKQFEKGKILDSYIGYAKSQITTKHEKAHNTPLFDINKGGFVLHEDKWKPQYLNAVKGYFDTYKEMAKIDKDWKDMENLFYNELPLTIAMLAVSGGLGNLARAGISTATRNVLGRIIATEGGKRMIPFVAESLAFAGEVVTFETSMRTMQYARTGNKKLFQWEGEHGLKNGYLHGAALFGMLRMGGRFVTPFLAKSLTPFKGMSPAQMTAFQKFAQKYTPRALSMAGVEAPILAGFEMATGNPENKAFMEIYLKYLRDLPAIAGGGHMFNSATGLNRVITRLDTRSKIFDLKHSSVANRREQGIALEKILESGEVPYETVFQWAQMKMTSKQVQDLAEFMTDSANQAFIAAIKADKQARMKTPEAQKMSDALVNKLVKLGFSKSVAKKMIDAAPIDLISKYKEKIFKSNGQRGFILNPFTSRETKLADTRNVFEATEFQGKSHQQIADALIQKGKLSLLNENLYQLKDLSVDVAKELIKAGHGTNVDTYLDHFKGDYKAIFEQMISLNDGYYLVSDLISNKKFRDKVDHQYIIDKLMEKGFEMMTPDVLPLLKNVDHNKLAWQLVKGEDLSTLLFGLHNFKNIDKEIFVKLIKSDYNRGLNENLDSFNCSRKELAEELLKLDYHGEYFLLNNSSLFKNTIDFNILVKRFIDRGDYKTLAHFLDSFQGHKVEIPKEAIELLLDRDHGDLGIGAIATNINLFKGAKPQDWIPFVNGYWPSHDIASSLGRYKGLDHLEFAKQLVENGYTEILIRHLKNFKELPPEFLKPIFEQLTGGNPPVEGNILKAAAINNYVKTPFDKTLKGVYDLFGETTNLFLYNTFKQLESGELPATVKALGINKTGPVGANQLRNKLREIRSELINGTANLKQIADNPILYRWLMKLVRYKKAENFVSTDNRDDARFNEILNNYLRHEEGSLKLPAGYERSGELLIQKRKKGNMSLELIPQRNILTEFSGFLADACYFQNKGSLIKEHPNVVSMTLVKNPGQASESFVGNILLIETRGFNGEPLLVVRGFNPQQNVINQLNMQSFYNETMSYLHKIARRRGRKLAIVIENRSNMATTNRPNFFAYLKAKKPDLQQMFFKSSSDSTINGHIIGNDTFLVKSSESVDVSKLKPETRQKVDQLEAQLKKRGVLGQTENIDTYITTRTINNIEKPQAFQQVLRVKDSIVAFNEKGQVQIFENSTAYEKYLDSHKVSKEKLKQKTDIPAERADQHTIDGKKPFIDSDLPTSYEKLKQLQKKDLVKYGIKKPQEIERFKKYVKYVGKIEKQLAKFEKQFANDKKTLEVIMNELGIVHNAIYMRKPSLKGRIRMTRKLLKELSGQFERLTDITRGSLTFSNHRDLYRALRSLKANPNVSRLEIRDYLNIRNPDGSFDFTQLSEHKTGFRHINAKIRLKSGRVVELQLHLKEIYKTATDGAEIPTGALSNIKFTLAQKALFEKIAKRIKEDGGPSIEFPDFSQSRISIKEQDIYKILRELTSKKPPQFTEIEKGLIMNLKHLSRELYNYSWKIYKSKNIF